MEPTTDEAASEHHHGSHRHLVDLLDAFEPATPGRVDAIVVPTIRHPRWLGHAVRLATALRCPLVSLHSRRWSSAEQAAALMPPDVDFIAIDVGPAVQTLNMPEFRTDRLLHDTPFHRPTDLGVKRNIGLLLARRMAWERVVFLDDDIEVGGHEEVARAAGLLDTYDAVGMHIGGYPDNSVVCHAHRAAGGWQESFVGGGALAVQTSRNRSFFPNVYNEDWFYLLGDKRLRPLAVTGMVRQRPYDPFDRPVRARDQEFGDVLAEGVYWLLDQESDRNWREAADLAHWAFFLDRRRNFIEDVLGRVRRLPRRGTPSPAAMEASLLAALGRLRTIRPDLCVAYMRAWAADREGWARHVERTTVRGGDVDDLGKWLVKKGNKPLDVIYRLR
ncbi:hypothetical protein JOL79_20880 [Microbispora sp. RL4-1S]|uniref:Uncharacterized protein n=1 Tax=Microbispora oryzae TaxID=2806554 RepID=A0A940WSK1_9ACTN|nr:hypothetical protein [Microbispora oryzae]MBP2706269.1 hypothetical protein [Microbispora oryzae]